MENLRTGGEVGGGQTGREVQDDNRMWDEREREREERGEIGRRGGARNGFDG